MPSLFIREEHTIEAMRDSEAEANPRDEATGWG